MFLQFIILPQWTAGLNSG